jgi:hypothetical protein
MLLRYPEIGLLAIPQPPVSQLTDGQRKNGAQGANSTFKRTLIVFIGNILAT